MFYIELETGQYPFSINQLRLQFPNISLPDYLDDELLSELGFARVQPGNRPDADVVEELQPVLIDGVWVQQFQGRDFTPQELAARADVLREQEIREGFSYTFPDNVERVVQIGDRDMVNLSSLLTAAQFYLNDVGKSFTFRTKENVNVELTPSQVIEMCMAAIEYRQSIIERSWSRKDLLPKVTLP